MTAMQTTGRFNVEPQSNGVVVTLPDQYEGPVAAMLGRKVVGVFPCKEVAERVAYYIAGMSYKQVPVTLDAAPAEAITHETLKGFMVDTKKRGLRGY